ncbi:hypothetical protein PQR57_42695 [Paraburkholderia dipogonis]|uniref:Uncharacterized protein n=1 Tax=Paraburkholderia dipogonis TaxID=1211383 RepID=A0ABW9B6J9_9BURK
MEFRTFVSPLALWKIGNKSILRQRTAELLGKPSSERQVDAPGERPLLADDRLMRSAYFGLGCVETCAEPQHGAQLSRRRTRLAVCAADAVERPFKRL